MKIAKQYWDGYARKDGRKGIRNKILVIYTVECSSFVAKEIVRLTDNREVEVVGFSGCTDNEYAVHLLISLIRHPNVGGVLAVGLGCEYVQPEWLAEIALKEGKQADWIFIQQMGGTKKAIEKGLEIVSHIQEKLKETPRVQMRLCDLTIGAECGGSDYTSGIAGNVIVGRFYDQLTQAGGSAVFEEIVETVGLRGMLEKRAANEAARVQLTQTYDKALEYCKSVRQYSVSPGNFAGGLSTIEEKSMGAFAKSGSKPIQGVLKVGERLPHSGLWLLDSTPDPHWMQFGITNPNDNEGLMALISCGCHAVLFVTGRGSVVGSAVAPVIKITGNSETYHRMEDDMDFDAGLALSGACTQEELALRLTQMIMDTAAGALTKSEQLGHKEYYIPYKYQNRTAADNRPCEK